MAYHIVGVTYNVVVTDDTSIVGDFFALAFCRAVMELRSNTSDASDVDVLASNAAGWYT